MSQSLYTAMSGISAATTSLQVISNNIANINTTGFKSSSVKFSDVFYRTVSSGSVATDSTGGTNPVQVGVGTQVSAVTKDFTSGSWMSTGKDTDLMIQGSGFFCVQSSDGSTFYTRDGSFSFDSDGNLVTSAGYKVQGTSTIMSATKSGQTVQIPLSICPDVEGTDSTTMGLQAITNLNNLSKNITSGYFDLTVTDSSGATYNSTVDLSGITSTTTVNQLNTLLQTGVNFTDATTGRVISGIGVSIVGGQIQLNTSNAIVSSGGVQVAQVSRLNFSTSGQTNATNFLTATGLSNSTLTTDTSHTSISAGTSNISVTIGGTTYNGTITALGGITANTTVAQLTALLNGAGGLNFTSGPDTISGITASVVNGQIQIDASNAVVNGGAVHPTAMTISGGTSNFASQTIVSGTAATTSAANQYYATNTLDYTVNISQLTSASESISATAETINGDGSIQVTYNDGSVLSVQLSADNATYEFIYTTTDNVQIKGSKCTVQPDVAEPSNFVIQIATITNTNGLISAGSNLYKAGPNSGDIVYTVGGHMGAGSLESGGLEASNVDLSQELSNMILSQRAIEANSRVFTTTSDVMSTIVQMGR